MSVKEHLTDTSDVMHINSKTVTLLFGDLTIHYQSIQSKSFKIFSNVDML